MATNLSGLDPRILSLLGSLTGNQPDRSSGEEDSGAPFGMPGGPGLDLIRTLSNQPAPTNFMGLPPSVSPVGAGQGDGDITTPSRMSRAPGPVAPIALGAMPNSSITPETVQQLFAPQGIAPTQAGFPQIQVMQGAPAMPQMSVPNPPGILAQAPTAATAAASLPQPHQMLAAAQMPGMTQMPTMNFSQLAGGGGIGGSGAQQALNLGTRGGTGTAAGGTGAAGLLAGLAKLLPGGINQLRNLIGGGGQIDAIDPLFNVEWAPGFGPEGPIFSGDPEAGLGEVSPGDLMPTGIEPSTWDLGALGGEGVDLTPFSGDPEAGLGASSLGDLAGSAGSMADIGPGLGDALPFLGPALGLGSALAGPNPGQAVLRQGENIALNQGLKYLANQSGATDWAGSQLSNLGDTLSGLFGGGGAGAAGTELGSSLAGMLGPEAAGAAFEGGLGGAAGLGAGEAAAGAGLGSLGLAGGLALAPFAIASMFGHMLEGTPNSLFGYRPEGWSAAHAAARTTQQNQSMDLSNSIINAASQLQAGHQLPGDIPGFLQQIATPKSPANMALFRAQDEATTENRGQWPQQQAQTLAGLKMLMDHYSDQLDPATKLGLAQAINARLPQGAQPVPIPDLTPDQLTALPWEVRHYYDSITNPDWYNQMAQQQMAVRPEALNAV